MQRNKLEMTDRELCVVSAVGSDYAGGGSGLDLQGGSIRLASAEERSCWRAGNRVSLTDTGGEIQSDGCWRVSNTSSWSEGSNNGFRKITLNARR